MMANLKQESLEAIVTTIYNEKSEIRGLDRKVQENLRVGIQTKRKESPQAESRRCRMRHVTIDTSVHFKTLPLAYQALHFCSEGLSIPARTAGTCSVKN